MMEEFARNVRTTLEAEQVPAAEPAAVSAPAPAIALVVAPPPWWRRLLAWLRSVFLRGGARS